MRAQPAPFFYFPRVTCSVDRTDSDGNRCYSSVRDSRDAGVSSREVCCVGRYKSRDPSPPLRHVRERHRGEVGGSCGSAETLQQVANSLGCLWRDNRVIAAEQILFVTDEDLG